jgi:fatty acid amide hydrolase
LRIGYYTTLPVFPSIGDTPDTVLKAKAALEAMGHTVVPFEIPDIWRLVHVFATLATADGGNIIYRKLKYDKISWVAEKFQQGRSLSSYLYSKIASLFVSPNPRALGGDPAAQKSEVLWEYLHEQRNIKYKVLDKMRDLNLDLILAPTFPFPAARVEDSEKLFGAASYTCIYNFLDFPAGVTPFGTESCTKIDSYDDEGDYTLKLAKEGIKFSKGMPITVQVIGKPFKEEMVLRVLNELEDYNFKN